MEGGYYAMIRGIMKFQCYPDHNHFTLHTNHKPFKFKLAIVSNAHGRKWRWVDLLLDFNFNIVHHLGLRHINVNALINKNLIGEVVQMIMTSNMRSKIWVWCQYLLWMRIVNGQGCVMIHLC